MNRLKETLIGACAALVVAALVGCGREGDEGPTQPTNHAPAVVSVTASPASVQAMGTTTLTCVATDEDRDVLTYYWFAPQGQFQGGTSSFSVTWQAPSTPGTYTITVIVSDGALTAQGSVNVDVLRLNHAPVIESVTASPPSIPISDTTALACSAIDPDGDTLTYIWSAPQGEFLGGSTSSSVTWQAPDTPGAYAIAVTVSDGALAAQGSVNVDVVRGNHAPVIESLTASPPSIPISDTTTLACSAIDPDGDTLTYVWSAPQGQFPGGRTSPSVTWQAPDTPGTYTITVIVSDGALTAQGSVNVDVIRVNRAPVLESVSASPPSIPLSGTTTLACSAIDPDGDTLAYLWSAPQGQFPGGCASSSVTWQAPDTAGIYAITVTVNDGALTAQGGVNVTVTAGIYFSDDFDDGDYDGWEYADHSWYNWDVTNGQLRADGGAASGNMLRRHAIHPVTNINAGDATYEFDLTKETGSWYTAAGFKFCDGNTNWNIAEYGYHEYQVNISAEGNGNCITMAKFVNGQSVGSTEFTWEDGTSPDQPMSTANNRKYHYMVVKDGASIKVYRDDILMQSVIDTSDRVHSPGNIGFVKQNCVWRVDNVLVR